MKTQVQAYKPKNLALDESLVQLTRMQPYITRALVYFMRICGIVQLSVKYDSVGMYSVLEKGFTASTWNNLPDSIKRLRRDIVKDLTSLAAKFQLLDIKIDPTDEDIKKIEALWAQVCTGRKADETPLPEVVIPYESDPTNTEKQNDGNTDGVEAPPTGWNGVEDPA